MYLEQLSLNGVIIGQSNTDGVLYRVKRSSIDKVNQIKT